MLTGSVGGDVTVLRSKSTIWCSSFQSVRSEELLERRVAEADRRKVLPHEPSRPPSPPLLTTAIAAAATATTLGAGKPECSVGTHIFWDAYQGHDVDRNKLLCGR